MKTTSSATTSSREGSPELSRDLADRPRIPLRGAADHDGGATGRAENVGRLGSRRDVARCNDRYVHELDGSAVSEWSAVPVYICFAERGWRVSEAAPASTSLGAIASAAREPSASPRRIFTDTGISIASATCSTIRQARFGSSRRVAPAPVFVTLRTGQPKDVDEVGARGLHHAGGLGHDAGLGAEDLDGEGMLVGADPEIPEGALVPVRETRAAHHLRADQGRPRSGGPAAGRPGRSRPPWGQHKPGRNLHRSDAPGRGQSTDIGRKW